MANNIRNIAIIAHVDHGKTTLVDTFLEQSHTKLNKDSNTERIMDTDELERERGITIFSKNASFMWEDTKINIIDTPGHADFGGEVERVLKMADGALLLIDAKEGPMPQTKFVLKKALNLKLKIIVIINKIDRKDARVDDGIDKTLDLFIDLGADDLASDFSILYASAKEGKAGENKDISTMKDMTPIFKTILEEVPKPSGDKNSPLQILITSLALDPHKGSIANGRIYNGTIKTGEEIAVIRRDGNLEKFRVSSLMTFTGLDKTEIEEAEAGDIVAIAGITEPKIGETITIPNNPKAMPPLAVEEPTISATFLVNDSPFAGKEGTFKTSRQLQERLEKEIKTDMALKVKNEGAAWRVSGRGELHLAILIERMRRQGYEFQVGKPKVIDREIDGKILTPYEKIYIDVPEIYSGKVIKKLTLRRGELNDMKNENDVVHLEFTISSRSFFGYRSEFVTDTRGTGVINSVFYKYAPPSPYTHTRDHGSLVSFESGSSTAHAIASAQDRGELFISPGVKVYKGQVIGQNSRSTDVEINICKTKNLTNMRSKGEGVADHIKSPRIMTLEAALEYISDDELVEVTPKSIRIRKIVLDKKEARRTAQKIN